MITYHWTEELLTNKLSRSFFHSIYHFPSLSSSLLSWTFPEMFLVPKIFPVLYTLGYQLHLCYYWSFFFLIFSNLWSKFCAVFHWWCVFLSAVIIGSPVLGYLAAGILIGPYGLSIIRHVHGTKAIAEFGVVFLLFNIGLEVGFIFIKSCCSNFAFYLF